MGSIFELPLLPLSMLNHQNHLQIPYPSLCIAIAVDNTLFCTTGGCSSDAGAELEGNSSNEGSRRVFEGTTLPPRAPFGLPLPLTFKGFNRGKGARGAKYTDSGLS
ncbi:uncharacterized protein RSE6_11924 [Rhynchosporium secalis]|uniref:Uncharacterized protein n=1 Tax=Rhynchosporium secalis TaxID=38038 RepID=A0A1E1MP31_RHYSE|nr:uncharacterized protein RSE6_11924 [Rhynchosporium secalis]